MQFPEFRFANSYRTSFNDTCYSSSYSVTVGFYLFDEFFHLFRYFSVRAAHRVAFYDSRVIFCIVEVCGYAAHL